MRTAAGLVTVFSALFAGACGGGTTTAAATCTDNVQNGTETAIDCGGGSCDKCAVGLGCAGAGDCQSGVCDDQGACACQAGFAPGSDGKCADVDDCAVAPCLNGGSCVDGVNSFTCTCTNGYSGPTCAEADPCTPDPCQNGATCSVGAGCAAGFWGDDCSHGCTSPAHCTGTVSCDQALGGTPVCTACTAGWKGTACADDVDECADALDNCAEGARCVNTIGGFTCGCAIGTSGDGTICTPCVAGKWGIDCAEVCVGGHCTGAPTCDAVDGSDAACAGCSDGYTGADCTATCDAGNCKDGAVRCNQADAADGACLTGCTAGWYGDACAAACFTEHCTVSGGTVITCDQTTGVPVSCPACAGGYTGANCEATCTQGNCTGTVVCAQSSPDQGRLCPDGCAAGWRGETCAGTCPLHAHCLGTTACDQTTGAAVACSSCDAGFYGTTCGSACGVPQNCIGAVTCNKDSGVATTCTTCLAGYYGTTCGSTCDVPHCIGTATCVKATGAAVSCDTCAAGYWGDTCQSQCDLISHCAGDVTCNKTTGVGATCSQCSAGYYGTTCSQLCSVAGCAGTATCDQLTGSPLTCSLCAVGKWGATCQNNCTSGNCTGAVTCDPVTGVRQTCEGCEAGYWGPVCNDVCVTGHCSGGSGTCDKASGSPTGCVSCETGYWGATCQSACAQGYCTGTVTCAQTGGAAISCTGCTAGHYGAACQSLCDKGHCTGNPTCGQNDGAAISCTGCSAGYYGTTCTSTCTHTGCVGTVTCNQGTGVASACAACDNGKWGTTCDSACAQGHCTGTVTCNKSSGAATSCAGCSTGFWGGTCGVPCDQGNCATAMTCDQGTGGAVSCPGCVAGFWGATCVGNCDPGHCAGTYTCAQANATPLTCSLCASGWLGSLCDSYAVQSCVEWRDSGATASGEYTIDPDGAGGQVTALNVWCDMTTHDGGFSFYKVKLDASVSAADAEAICAGYGMQLFIPRSAQHLASAFAVATSAGFGPDGSTDYLHILGIYPNVKGAACANQPFNSGNAACNWSAADAGAFWVSNRTDIGQPNGNNDVDASMSYTFTADGAVQTYDDVVSPGYTSDRFMCDLGDRDFIGHSCKDWYDAGFHLSGTYTIDPDGLDGPLPTFQAYCDQVTNGGGWTEITPCVALHSLGGTMVAVEAAPTAGIDANCLPYTRDAAGVHSYYYTFTFPAGFTQFYLSGYQARANAGPGNSSDITPSSFVMSNWNVAYLAGGTGDIGFGSGEAAGPVTSYAATLGVTTSCEACTLAWPPGTQIYSVGATSTHFRIGWGEAGPEFEGWYPWYSGTIRLR